MITRVKVSQYLNYTPEYRQYFKGVKGAGREFVKPIFAVNNNLTIPATSESSNCYEYTKLTCHNNFIVIFLRVWLAKVNVTSKVITIL